MNGLLIVPPVTGVMKNIGDYIQSIAQEQFWDRIDCYVERERLASFKSEEKVNLIMQGWFMWTAEQFPPSKDINPFFISFHLSPLVVEKLLTLQSISYFKSYEPIGCRDYNTKRILESKGIKCYFSGCLTLTLGIKYSPRVRTQDIYIVDPFFERGYSKEISRFKRIWILLTTILKYPKQVNVIKRKYSCGKDYKKSIYKWIDAASLYCTYSKVFSDDILLGATYMTHIINVSGMSEEQKLELARNHIRKYGAAKLIITSRIHAALPAIALGTPAIFFNSEYLENKGNSGAAGRFDGLLELMNYINITPKGVLPGNDYMNNIMKSGKIGSQTVIYNPDTYKSICSDLIHRVKRFVSKCESGG